MILSMRASDGERQDMEGLKKFFASQPQIDIDWKQKPGDYWEITAPTNYFQAIVDRVEKYGFWISQTHNEEGEEDRPKNTSIYDG